MDQIFQSGGQLVSPTKQLAQTRFLNRTYGWMFFGLLLTAVVSLAIASSEEAIRFIFEHRGIYMLVMLVELGVVFGLSMAQNRLNAMQATLGFLLYSALNGITFSVIFMVYQVGSIGQIFLLAAGMFAGMAVFGAVTKKNLTGMGTFMAMGLIGVVILGLINLFIGSASLNFGLGLAGIVIFSGLTAYDVQRIRAMALEYGAGDSDAEKKGAIFGALALYLDFINLFLSLLRVFGRRRD